MEELYRQHLFPSKTKFLKIARDAGHSRAEALEFLSGRVEQEAFKRPVLPQGKFDHRAYDFALMADLMDMSRHFRQNRGYKWILNVLDFKSRYVWSFPLKTKRPSEVAPLVEKVLLSLEQFKHWKEMGVPIQLMFVRFITDDGNEFRGEVSRVLEKYGVMRLIATNVRKSTAPVERFNGTLLKGLNRIMVATRKENWIDYLDEIVTLYNNSEHSGIGKKPIEAANEGSEMIIDLDNVPEKRFTSGDVVRTVESRDLFAKKTLAPKLSLETFRVVRYKPGGYVVIADKSGKEKTVDERLLVPATENKEPVEGFIREVRERTVKNRANRLARKEIAVGHEGYVSDDGSIKLKPRLLPASEKRRPKKKV